LILSPGIEHMQDRLGGRGEAVEKGSVLCVVLEVLLVRQLHHGAEVPEVQLNFAFRGALFLPDSREVW